MKQQPIQPIVTDEHGVERFQGNSIVRHLLDMCPDDLNDLARLDFPQADWEQFAQLIGYSVSGFKELSYVTDDTCEVVDQMKKGLDERDAELRMLRRKLKDTREILRQSLVPLLFHVHPDDLQAGPSI